MRIIIANSSEDPIYRQIYKQIKSQIISGELVEGDPLLSIRKLSKELLIGVITVKKAYEELEEDGFIDTVGGKGCFVAMQNKELLKEKKMQTVGEKMGGVVTDAKKLGINLEELKEMLTILFKEED